MPPKKNPTPRKSLPPKRSSKTLTAKRPGSSRSLKESVEVDLSEAAAFQRLLPTFYLPERRAQDYEYNLYLSIIGERETQTEQSFLSDLHLTAALPNRTKTGQTQTNSTEACKRCKELTHECLALNALLQKRNLKWSESEYIAELENTLFELDKKMLRLKLEK